MRLINWNIERRGPLTWQAASIVSEMHGLHPDLVVLTEAHENSLLEWGGHTLSHPGYNHARKQDSERLVIMWSRSAWEEVPLPAELQRNGGAILGRTLVQDRPVFCLAICIPWHMSPSIPPQEKVVPWAQHTRFLHLLKSEMGNLLARSPLIIAGDFNRFIPRGWGPKDSYALLEETFAGTDIVTQGRLQPLDLETIDHVALSGPVLAQSVRILNRFDARGRPRSDHCGVMVDMGWA